MLACDANGSVDYANGPCASEVRDTLKDADARACTRVPSHSCRITAATSGQPRTRTMYRKSPDFTRVSRMRCSRM